jgi:hypothetical protein
MATTVASSSNCHIAALGFRFPFAHTPPTSAMALTSPFCWIEHLLMQRVRLA